MIDQLNFIFHIWKVEMEWEMENLGQNVDQNMQNSWAMLLHTVVENLPNNDKGMQGNLENNDKRIAES